MFKIFNLFVGQFSKLFESASLLALLKASPLIIIPILLYMLGTQYLETNSEKVREELYLNKIRIALEVDSSFAEPISFFMLRHALDEEYLTIYLEVLSQISKNDSVITWQNMKKSSDFVRNLKDFYQQDVRYEFARQYFLKQPGIDSILLIYLIKESEKYKEKDFGKERLIFLLSEDSIIDVHARQKYKNLINPYFNLYKIKKSIRKKIIPENK